MFYYYYYYYYLLVVIGYTYKTGVKIYNLITV